MTRENESDNKYDQSFFKVLYRRFLKNWVLSCTASVFVVLILMWIYNPWGVVDTFFGEGKTIKKPQTWAEVLSYIGLVCGAILILGNQYAANRRNLIIEKGNLDIRFKDAALLLANEATSAIISGIYALHQIAVEASKGDKNEQGYVKTIHSILCAFVQENWRKSEDGNPIGNKPTIVLQTIMDVLFKNKKNIYKEYHSDFTSCVFTKIDFSNATLTDVDFRKATLTDVDFSNATLRDVDFSEATLTDVSFNRHKISALDNMIDAKLRDVIFYKATLTGVDFSEATLTDVDFERAKLRVIGFRKTVLKGYSYEEITREGRSLELTKARDK